MKIKLQENKSNEMNRFWTLDEVIDRHDGVQKIKYKVCCTIASECEDTLNSIED